jgi:hypothetical protein
MRRLRTISPLSERKACTCWWNWTISSTRWDGFYSIVLVISHWYRSEVADPGRRDWCSRLGVPFVRSVHVDIGRHSLMPSSSPFFRPASSLLLIVRLGLNAIAPTQSAGDNSTHDRSQAISRMSYMLSPLFAASVPLPLSAPSSPHPSRFGSCTNRS